MSTVRETFIGVVTDNNDPQQLGRIKVACASLMGVDDNNEPIEYPQWIPPLFPFLENADGEAGSPSNSGFFFIPNIGTSIEFEITVSSKYDQMPGQSSISNPDPRWRAALLTSSDGVNEDFTKNYPDRKGWRSRSGHLLLFDDTDDVEEQKVTLRHGGSSRSGTGSYLSINGKGDVTLGTENGQLLYINDSEGNKDEQGITILDANSNMINLSAEGVTIVHGKKGHIITMNDDGVFIMAAGTASITANSAKLDAKSVELGGTAVEAVIKGNTFQALFNAHTHVGNLGAPTAPPVIPLSGAELSTTTKTE